MSIETLVADQLKKDLPRFSAGDTVRVHNKIIEGDKERIQVFEGVVLKRVKGEGIRGSFTVRRIASGVGVERTFLLHSPNVAKIELVREGKVRRARLYYLRDLKTKSIRIKEDKRAIYAKSESKKATQEQRAKDRKSAKKTSEA